MTDELTQATGSDLDGEKQVLDAIHNEESEKHELDTPSEVKGFNMAEFIGVFLPFVASNSVPIHEMVNKFDEFLKYMESKLNVFEKWKSLKIQIQSQIPEDAKPLIKEWNVFLQQLFVPSKILTFLNARLRVLFYVLQKHQLVRDLFQLLVDTNALKLLKLQKFLNSDDSNLVSLASEFVHFVSQLQNENGFRPFSDVASYIVSNQFWKKTHAKSARQKYTQMKKEFENGQFKFIGNAQFLKSPWVGWVDAPTEINTVKTMTRVEPIDSEIKSAVQEDSNQVLEQIEELEKDISAEQISKAVEVNRPAEGKEHKKQGKIKILEFNFDFENLKMTAKKMFNKQLIHDKAPEIPKKTLKTPRLKEIEENNEDDEPQKTSRKQKSNENEENQPQKKNRLIEEISQRFFKKDDSSSNKPKEDKDNQQKTENVEKSNDESEKKDKKLDTEENATNKSVPTQSNSIRPVVPIVVSSQELQDMNTYIPEIASKIKNLDTSLEVIRSIRNRLIQLASELSQQNTTLASLVSQKKIELKELDRTLMDAKHKAVVYLGRNMILQTNSMIDLLKQNPSSLDEWKQNAEKIQSNVSQTLKESYSDDALDKKNLTILRQKQDEYNQAMSKWREFVELQSQLAKLENDQSLEILETNLSQWKNDILLTIKKSSSTISGSKDDSSVNMEAIQLLQGKLSEISQKLKEIDITSLQNKQGLIHVLSYLNGVAQMTEKISQENQILQS